MIPHDRRRMQVFTRSRKLCLDMVTGKSARPDKFNYEVAVLMCTATAI